MCDVSSTSFTWSIREYFLPNRLPNQKQSFNLTVKQKQRQTNKKRIAEKINLW